MDIPYMRNIPYETHKEYSLLTIEDVQKGAWYLMIKFIRKKNLKLYKDY